MTETERYQIKGALLKCAKENENRPTFTGHIVVSSLCKSAVERIEELEKEAEERARKLEESQTLGVYNSDEELAQDIGRNADEASSYKDESSYVAEYVYNKCNARLVRAKKIIKEMLSILPKENIEGIYEITEEAEQFLRELEE